MNTGIFGEGFPYSNFHDLNMDWIIKIAKDFLDQYTHIQEIIEQGKEDIETLTESGVEQIGDLTTTSLQDLQEKADALTALLQQWYDTHSEDIANQLAGALADLNEWYTTHQNYLDQTLADNLLAFQNEATQKATNTIATIPDDYTTVATTAKELTYETGGFKRKGSFFEASGINKYYDMSTHTLTNWFGDTFCAFNFFVHEGQVITFRGFSSALPTGSIGGLFYDNNGVYTDITVTNDGNMTFIAEQDAIIRGFFSSAGYTTSILNDITVEVIDPFSSYHLNQSIYPDILIYKPLPSHRGWLYQVSDQTHVRVENWGLTGNYLGIDFEIRKGQFAILPYVMNQGRDSYFNVANWITQDVNGVVTLISQNPPTNRIYHASADQHWYFTLFKNDGFTEDFVNSLEVRIFNESDAKSPTFLQEVERTSNLRILHLGTSIPEGSGYPVRSARNCGIYVRNNSIGGSSLSWLSMSSDVPSEIAWFAQEQGKTVEQVEADPFLMGGFFNARVAPFINGTSDTCNVIVLDHGYNDGVPYICRKGYTTATTDSDIDWHDEETRDFFGFFQKFRRKVLAINPNIRIIIAGYMENQSNYNPDGDWNDFIDDGAIVCHAQKLIAEHYCFPLIDTWNYTGWTKYDFVPNTSNFLAEYNAEYGTNYTAHATDQSGNISSFQYAMPDCIHPHTDKTGNTEDRLTTIFTDAYKRIF